MNVPELGNRTFCDVLPLFLFVLFFIYVCGVANAQEHIEFQNTSTVGDNQSQSIPWIGLGRTINVTEGIANELGMNEPIGVLVTKVFPESPAHEAGIVEGQNWESVDGIDIKLGGDVILRADNETIKDRNHFEKLLRDKAIGDNLKLTIYRDSRIQEIDLTVSSKPGLLHEQASIYANPANVKFSFYQNIELGLEIEYPLNWDIVDYERPHSVTFRSLPEYSDDIGREYLRINVGDGFFDSVRAIDIINETEALPNLKFVELPHNITLSNNSGAKTVYTYTDNTRGEIKVLKAAVENNDEIYIFTYFAERKI